MIKGRKLRAKKKSKFSEIITPKHFQFFRPRHRDKKTKQHKFKPSPSLYYILRCIYVWFGTDRTNDRPTNVYLQTKQKVLFVLCAFFFFLFKVIIIGFRSFFSQFLSLFFFPGLVLDICVYDGVYTRKSNSPDRQEVEYV